MALRIHFTGQDLLRVCLASAPDPVAEALFAARLMQHQHETLRGWRRHARDQLTAQPQAAMLASLLPARSWMVDLFTLCGLSDTLEHGLDNLRHRTRATLRCEIDDTARRRRLPSWSGRLADGELEWLDHLDSAIRAIHQAAVAPYWPRIKAHLNAEYSTSGRLMLSSGVERMLATLQPQARWHSPVLHLPAPYDQEIHLQGRGLLIVHSMYCWPSAVPMYDGDDEGAPPRLYVPAARDLFTFNQITASSPPAEEALSALIGRTRTALLYAIADGHATTSDLAGQVGVSLASVSQHTAVLRGTGLISTRRAGMAVHHALTPLGRRILEEQAC